MKRNLIIAMVLMMLGATAPATAMDCARTVSTLGRGPSQGVAVIGDLAVIGAGPAVVTFDITDPAHPQRFGETDFGEIAVPTASFGDLAVAFVYDYPTTRLALIDPHQQASPLEVGSVELPDGISFYDVVVIGTTAWIATSSPEKGLLGVDLTDPGSPDLTHIMELPGTAESITAVGDRVFMASRQVGLIIVDVSDPADPTMIGSLDLPGAAAIGAITEHAYVATFSGSGGRAVHTIDIADPTAPALISSVPYPYVAWPQSMAIIDDRLFLGLIDLDPMIATPEGGIVVYDINDPDAPAEIDYRPFSRGPQRFGTAGETLVAADSERGLRIFSNNTTTGLTEIARRNVTLDDAFAVAVRGEIAFLGDQGLRIIDISDHTRPTELGSAELEGSIMAVAADETGERVAALAWGGELSLVDASDPAQPVVRSAHPTNGVDVSIFDTIVAVAEGDQGVVLIDVTDLEAPTLLARISTSSRALAVSLDSGIAVIGLVVNSVVEGAVAIYDITDPNNPILMAQLPTSNRVYAVDVADSKAAILTGSSILMIDISNPSAPVELGSSDLRFRIPEDIAIDGSTVHVSSWPGSFHMIDFSNPSGPFVRAATTWDPFGIMDGGPQGGYGVSVHNGAAVIADGRYGLRIVSVGRCRPAPDPDHAPAALD